MLLFNDRKQYAKCTARDISIHLMLLFNNFRTVTAAAVKHFNTSNVTIQLYKGLKIANKAAFQYI